MKKLMVGAVATLAAVTLSGCAPQNNMATNKVVITGEPVVLHKNGNVYVVPSHTVMAREGYYYVKVNNKEKVCYATQQPNLVGLNLLVLNVNVGGTSTTWSCYDVSPNYYVIQR